MAKKKGKPARVTKKRRARGKNGGRAASGKGKSSKVKKLMALAKKAKRSRKR